MAKKATTGKKMDSQPYENKAVVPSYKNKPSVNCTIEVLIAHDGLEKGQLLRTTRRVAMRMANNGYWKILD